MSKTSPASSSSKALVNRPPSGLPAARRSAGRDGSGYSGQALSAGFILYAMRQWWKVAAPAGLLLAALIAVTLYALFEPTYEATSLFQIDDMTPYVVDRPVRVSQRFVQTQIELIRSPLVLGPALVAPVRRWDRSEQTWEETEKKIVSLPELQEAEAPIEWLKEQIQIKPVGQSELYRISYSGTDPEHAANIVNAVTDAYFALREQEDAKRAQKTLDLLEKERDNREREIRRLRENVSQRTEQLDPAAGGRTVESLLNDPMAGLPGRLITAEVEREVLESRIKALEELLKQPVEVPKGMVEQAVQEHAEVLRLRAGISGKQAKLYEIKAKSARGEQDPAYLKLCAEIDQDENMQQELQKELQEQIRERLEQAQVFSRTQELADMRAEMQGYVATEELLRKRLQSRVSEVKDDNIESLQLEFMRAELTRAEQFHDLIADRAESIRIEGRAGSRVTRLSAARVPSIPAELVPYKPMALGLLAGLCLPFGLAVLWERMLRRVSDTDSLEKVSNLSVIGEIASLPSRKGAGGGSSSKRIGQDLRVFEESIDSLRTSLVLSEELKDVKVLAVTSAANNEGKTSVASQLAVSVARASGQPTLLIDGDMRSPDVHGVFEIPLSPGLADVLAGECAIQDAIVTSWSKYVHLLPAGKLGASPHKLLGNGKVKSMLASILESYRYIIIDTPPVLAASESLVLAKAADASLICAMRDISRGDQVRKACERLAAAGTRPIGTVLNGVPTKRYAYRYGSYAYVRQQ